MVTAWEHGGVPRTHGVPDGPRHGYAEAAFADRRPNPILVGLDWSLLLNGLPHVVDVPGLPGQLDTNMAAIRAKAYRMGRRIPVIVETRKVAADKVQIQAFNPYRPQPGGFYYWVQKQLWGLPQEPEQPAPVDLNQAEADS